MDDDYQKNSHSMFYNATQVMVSTLEYGGSMSPHESYLPHSAVLPRRQVGIKEAWHVEPLTTSVGLHVGVWILCTDPRVVKI